MYTLFSVFRYPYETLSLVYDKLLETDKLVLCPKPVTSTTLCKDFNMHRNISDKQTEFNRIQQKAVDIQSVDIQSSCAGLVSQPLLTVAVMANIIQINYSHEGYIVTGFVLCGLSVLTSTVISVDRLLALLLGLRYRHVVTLRRTRAVIACFFVIGVSCGTVHFWDKYTARIAIIVFGVVFVITSIFSYTKIYLKLRKH